MFEEVKKKIMEGLDGTKLGTDETSPVALTMDERAYVLGALNISHDLVLDIKDGEPTAVEWFTKVRPVTRGVKSE